MFIRHLFYLAPYHGVLVWPVYFSLLDKDLDSFIVWQLDSHFQAELSGKLIGVSLCFPYQALCSTIGHTHAEVGIPSCDFHKVVVWNDSYSPCHRVSNQLSLPPTPLCLLSLLHHQPAPLGQE